MRRQVISRMVDDIENDAKQVNDLASLPEIDFNKFNNMLSETVREYVINETSLSPDDIDLNVISEMLCAFLGGYIGYVQKQSGDDIEPLIRDLISGFRRTYEIASSPPSAQ